MPVFDNFQQCGPSCLVKGLDAKIIHDKQVLLFNAAKFFEGRSVGSGHFDLGEQFDSVGIKHLVAQLAGLVAQGRRQEALARSGRTGNEQVLAPGDKSTIGQAVQLVFVYAPVGSVVDLPPGGGLVAEAGFAQAPFDGAVVPVVPLAALVSRAVISSAVRGSGRGVSRAVLNAWYMPKSRMPRIFSSVVVFMTFCI